MCKQGGEGRSEGKLIWLGGRLDRQLRAYGNVGDSGKDTSSTRFSATADSRRTQISFRSSSARYIYFPDILTAASYPSNRRISYRKSFFNLRRYRRRVGLFSIAGLYYSADALAVSSLPSKIDIPILPDTLTSSSNVVSASLNALLADMKSLRPPGSRAMWSPSLRGYQLANNKLLASSATIADTNPLHSPYWRSTLPFIHDSCKQQAPLFVYLTFVDSPA